MTSPREPKPPALEAVQPAVQPAIKVPSGVPRAAEHAAEASATTPSSSLMGGLDAESRIKVRLVQQLTLLALRLALLQPLRAYCGFQLFTCMYMSHALFGLT